MATSTRCRRGVRRFLIPESAAAVVEFVYPSPNGASYALPLVDVSVSGLSFAAGPELAGLGGGSTIPSVVVRFAALATRGELLVMHVTPRSPERRIVGALFYPAEDVDLVKWKSVVAGVEAAQGG